MSKIFKKLSFMAIVFALLFTATNTTASATDINSESSISQITPDTEGWPISIYMTHDEYYTSPNDIKPSIPFTYRYNNNDYKGTLSIVSVETGGGVWTAHYAGTLYIVN